MASFSEWSNNKMRQATGATKTTGATQKAQTFSAWSNQKLGKEDAQKNPASGNTAFDRSGKTRDEYDSSVRQNYAARAAASDKLTEGEYNRSTAMQQKYGSYQNYLVGATADGKYYSQPKLGADMERKYNTVTTYEANAKKKAEELQSANETAGNLYTKLNELSGKLPELQQYAGSSTIASGIVQQMQQEYASTLKQYEDATKAVDAAYAAYEPAWNQYKQAAEDYEAYRTEQQTLFDNWKKTIRTDENAINADLTAAQSNVKQLQAQQKTLQKQAQQLMNKVSSRRGGTNELMQWSQQAQALQAQAKAMDGQIAEAQGAADLLQEELDWKKYYQYADLTSAEDFAEKSQYKSTANGKKRSNLDILFDNYSDDLSGWDDPLYEYINGNSEAGAYITNQARANYGGDSNPLGALFGMATEDRSESQQMTDEEVAIFNYLYASQGKDAAHAYYDYLTGDLNYRQRQEEEAYWRDYAKESPVGSSVFSVLTSPMKGLSYLGQAADYLGTGTIDQNAAYNRFSYANSAIRNQVAETIEQSGNWGQAGSFLYQTGMSMGDFLLNTAITGGFGGGGALSEGMSLAIMGTGAAADATIAAKDRGLTDTQAFTLGTIAGAAEVFTEKFSIEALLKGKWEDGAIKYILKNAFTEGAEEVGSDFINLFADILIAKDKSEWQQTIDAYMAEGKTEGEAFGLAVAQQAAEMGLDFLGGALSGGTMATAGVGIGTVQRNAGYQQTGSTLRKMGDEMVDSIIETAETLDENSEAYKLGQELKNKLNKGKKLTDTEIGRLFAETTRMLEGTEQTAGQTETAQEQAKGVVLPTAEETGGTVLPTAEQAETQTQQRTTEQERQSAPPRETVEMQQPGVLPTAEQAETRRRAARAETEAERTGILAGVDEDTIAKVQRIGNIVGREVVFFDEGADSAGGMHNGYYNPADGKIYVNARSQNPVAQIISHELTHSIESSGHYSDLQKLVLNRIQQTGGDLQAMRQQKAELYARHGENLTDNAAIDSEIVAEYVEKYLLTDEQSIRAMVQQNRTLGQRILQFINELLAKLGNSDAQERAFLTKAKNYYQSALQETQSSFTADMQQRAAAQAQNMDTLQQQMANGEISEEDAEAAFNDMYDPEIDMQQGLGRLQHSYAGANANGANLESLQEAQAMQEAGADMESIRKATGWHQFADGKWRFEIDDSRMQLRTDAADIPNYTTLGELVDAPELFEAYPDMADLSVTFHTLEDGQNGGYSRMFDDIELSRDLKNRPEALLNSLIHEVQHAIQNREGFASGANPAYWNRRMENGFDSRTAEERREGAQLQEQYEQMRESDPQFVAAMEELDAMAPKVPRGKIDLNTWEQIEPDPPEWVRYDERRDQLEEQYGDRVWDWYSLRDSIDRNARNGGRMPTDLYRDTAGEIEARDTAKRRELTTQERRETSPDLGNEDTVFADGGDGYAMSQSEQDSVKEQLREHQDALNNMKAVATIRDNGWKGMSTGAFRQKIVNDLKKTGYRVDNPSIGVIDFDEKLLNRSLNYIQTDAEAVAYQALPQVLKRGIEISGHGNHKGRDYETLTIAAPVELNGKRGNMAVVVMKTKGNRYKVHRILTPEGEAFALPEMTNAELNTAGTVTSGSQSLGGSAPAISSASETDAAKAENPSPGTNRNTASVSADSVAEKLPPVKKRFSIDEPVERTKDLIAVHNKDWSVIRDAALNWGGIPSPSVAIVDAAEGHTKYGDTSVVFPRATIDPEADPRNKVYGGDAWTPTKDNAIVEREVNYEARRAFDENIRNLSSQFAGGVFQGSGTLGKIGLENETRWEPAEIADKLANHPEVQAAFLQSEGKSLEPVYRDKQFDRFFSNATIQRYLDTVGEQKAARLAVKLMTGERMTAEEMKPAEQAIREVYAEEHANFLNRRPESKEKRIDYYMKNNVFPNRVEDFIRSAQEFYESGGSAGEIDKEATAAKMMEMIAPGGSWSDALQTVKDWVQPQLEGLLGERGIYNGKDTVTDSGRRSFAQTHWDYTAENIVKAMNMAAAKGANMYGVTPETLAATATREYKNVDEMHADEARLRTVSEEEHAKALRDLGIYLDRVVNDLMLTTMHRYDNTFEEEQNLSRIIAEAAKGKKTTAAVKAAFRKEGYAISDGHAKSILALIDRAANIPTGYYEAKAQRVVPFSEAAAIIAPTSAPAEEIAAVKAATGVDIIQYETGNEEQRKALVNGLEGVKFSISEDGEYDGAVKLKESTIDTYLRDYAAKSSPKYAKAYIAYMTPDDFLSLTTSEGGRQIVERHSKELDAEKLGEATRWQPIQLNIDHETGEVQGHEGRHRAVAMRNAGVEQIPVLLFDSSNKYSKSEIGELTLTGQDFGGTWSDAQVQVHDLLPLSYENRDAVMERFTMPTDERTLQYSVTEEETSEATLPTAEDEERKDSIRTSLPKKAQDYLKRAENALVGRVSRALSVPRFAQREYLQEIAQKISEEYLTTGRVSEETAAELFEQAYSEGVVVDEEFYQQYKDIKDHLRTQAVTISEEDKHDIADFNDFRKSAFGQLRIVNEGGLPVDVAYQELQDMAPELFPDDLTHPADQLVRMFEVAQSIEKTEKSLSEYYGQDAEEFKRWAKNDFDAAIGDTIGDLRTVKRYADERTAKANAAAETPMTTEQVTEAYKQLKKARWESEKAKAKNLLTDHDNIQLGRLLKGEIELEHLDPKTDNVKGITAVYEATTEYERLVKLLTEYKQSQRAKLREEADKFLETANDWKDKKAGLAYARETMERNFEDIVPDRKLAKEIVQEYITPVHDAEAKSTRFKTRYRDKVRALNLSTKETKAMQKEGKISEAHAVQLLGEAMDNIRMLENSRGRMAERDGKTLSDWRGIVQDMQKQNPDMDWAKIRSAVQTFREIYDDLFQQLNEVRVRNGYEPINYRNGYFPHFQPGDGDSILSQFGRAMGIDTQVTTLPTTINGLTHTFKPGITWFGNAQQRLGFNTAYDAVEGFDKYIEGVASVIFQTENIQKLRALATQARYRTGDEGIQKQVDAVYADTRLTEEEKQSKIDAIYKDGRFALSNFVNELDEYTNLLANKKSKYDRTAEAMLGRRLYTFMKNWESRVGANMIAGNLSSALTNFIPLTQARAQVDRASMLKGMWDTLRAYKTDDGFADMSSFLTNRRGSDPIVKTWAQKTSSVLGKPMEFIDTFTADSIVRARYNQNLKRGLSEAAAMSEADAFAGRVMADRSKGSVPTLFEARNPLFKAFTQFQLEVNNQFSEVFKDLPRAYKEKGLAALAAALLKYFIGAFLLNEVYEYVVGRRPALDPLGILNDTVGDITGYELPNLVELGVGAITGDMPSFEVEKAGIGAAGKNLTENLLGELPFSSGLALLGADIDGGRIPAASAIPDLTALWDAATTEGWSGEKRWKEVQDELYKLAYILPPFGGNQAQKIWKSTKALIEGGSYTVDADGNEKLQYPVFTDDPMETALNAGRMILFGKSSLPTAQDWVENNFNTLSAEQTAAYKDMLDAGVRGEDAYDLLDRLRRAEKTDEHSKKAVQRDILRQADVPDEGKAIAYYALMATDKEREVMDMLDGADVGTVTTMLMDIKDAESLTGAAKSNAKRDAIAEAALIDEEKQTAYRYTMGEKQEDGSYTTSRDDDIMAFEQAGLDFDTFLKVQNEYTTVNEKYSGASEKAVEFSRWVNSQNLTAEQAETVRDCFKYYSQIPAEAARYDSFVSAGLDDDAAYALANSLNALEPEEGKDSVSSLQRYRTVVDAGLSTDEQMTVLGEMMQESEYGKLQTGYSYGVTPEAYVTFRELLPKFDFDGNGTFKQEEVEAAIDSMGGGGNGIVLPGAGGGQSLTVTQQAALWQLANKSWKPAKNPYSTSVGQKVYDALNAETESGIVLPDGTSYTGGLVLPKG